MRDTELAGLARTLSKDLDLTITVGGERSCCSPDGSRINIARMPATNLGRQLMCGLIFHEIGHKNHTSGERPAGLLGHLTNVIEDIRVEQLTMAERPGTRFDLDAVVRFYTAKAPPQPKNVPAALLGLVMAVGRSKLLGQDAILPQVAPCRELLQETFGDKTVKSVMDAIDQQLARLASTRDSQRLAESLLEMVAGPEEASRLKTALSPSEEPAPPEPTAPDGADLPGGETSAEPPPAAEKTAALFSADPGETGDIGRFLVDALDQLAEQVPAREREGIPQYPAVGRGPSAPGALDAAAALVASARMRTRLPRLLQGMSRQPIVYASSGRRLVHHRLVALASGNPKIFHKKVSKEAVDTAVVILLDHSGSMYGSPSGIPLYEIANQAAFAIHHTLHGLSGVAAATVSFANREEPGENLQLLCDFGQKPGSRAFGLEPTGGTPTDAALWYARSTLLHRPEIRKVILLLTDGQPNDAAQTRIATRRCRKDGLEIAALGLMSDAVKHYWEHYQVINRVQDLPQAMFVTLEGLLRIG